MSIVGEGGEAVHLLEDGQIKACTFDGFKATKGLLVLGEDANDLLGVVVASGDVLTLDGTATAAVAINLGQCRFKK